MRKGLTVTLVMVAIALSGYHALGRAPEITNVPDIIIGDENSVTFPNLFVFPDAFNLNSKVNDPDGSDGAIIWSFFESTGTYRINGVQSLAATTSDSLVNPPTDRRIAGPGINPDDPAIAALRTAGVKNFQNQDIDTSGITVTFRNVRLSPIGGSNTDPGGGTIIAGDTKVLTLFASDGSTVSQNPGPLTGMMMVYTNANGNDDTSPGTPLTAGTPIWDQVFTTSQGVNELVETGSVTHSQSTNALCMEVPGPGDNRGEIATQYGGSLGIDLVANAVYHARVTGRTNQAQYGTVPMIMVLFENGSQPSDPGGGAGAYTAEHVFLANDGQGGANVFGSRAWDVYYAPLAFQTPQWNSLTTGGFAPAFDAYNDMRFRFRVFDYANGGWGGASDLGQICLEEVDMNRFDYPTERTVGAEVLNVTANLTSWRAVMTTGAAGDLTATAAGDGVTLVHSGSVAAWTNQIAEFLPGDGVLGGYTAPEVNDDYPVAWEANQLYQVDVEFANTAPTSPNDQASDIIRVGVDTPTAEMSFMSGQSAQLASAGSPKATKATYTTFLYSHDVSLTPAPTLRRLRPRIDMLNATDYSANGNVTGATDPVKIFTIKVTKVSFP